MHTDTSMDQKPSNVEMQEATNYQDIVDNLKAVWKKKWFILLVAAVVFIGASIWVSNQMPFYKATCTMLFNPKTISGIKDSESGDIQNLSMQAEIMRSPALINEVVRKYNLTTVEPFNKVYSPVDLFRNLMEIKANGASKTVEVSFYFPQPEIAALVANGIAESFIYSGFEKSGSTSESSMKSLGDQTSELTADVNKIKKQIADFIEEHPELEDEKILNQQLEKLNTELVDINTRRIEVSTNLKEIERFVKEGGDIFSHPVIRSRGSISKKLDDLRAGELKLKGLEQEYREKHPKIVATKLEIDAAKRALSLEIKQAIEEMQEETKAYQAREKTIQSSIVDIQGILTKMAPQKTELAKLQSQEASKVQLVKKLNERISEESITARLRRPGIEILSQAEPPIRPVRPDKPKILLGALLGGLFLGAGLVFVKEMLDNSVRSPEDLEAVAGETPLIGEVPFQKLRNEELEPQFKSKKIESVYTQAMNFIHTNINFVLSGTNKKTLLFTSSTKGEGKSFTVYHLAKIMHTNGKKVCVLDADFRRSVLKNAFPAAEAEAKGLDQYLTEKAGVEDIIEKTKFENLDFIRSGHAHFSAPDALRSHQMKELLSELKKRYDYILIDTPPLLHVIDSIILSSVVDSVMLAIRWGKTDKRLIRKAIKKLAMHNIPIEGAVFTMSKDVKIDYYYY